LGETILPSTHQIDWNSSIADGLIFALFANRDFVTGDQLVMLDSAVPTVISHVSGYKSSSTQIGDLGRVPARFTTIGVKVLGSASGVNGCGIIYGSRANWRSITTQHTIMQLGTCLWTAGSAAVTAFPGSALFGVGYQVTSGSGQPYWFGICNGATSFRAESIFPYGTATGVEIQSAANYLRTANPFTGEEVTGGKISGGGSYAITRNDKTTKFYRDGKLFGTDTTMSAGLSVFWNNTDVTVGTASLSSGPAGGGGPYECFGGRFGPSLVWNRALADDEIAAIMNDPMVLLKARPVLFAAPPPPVLNNTAYPSAATVVFNAGPDTSAAGAAAGAASPIPAGPVQFVAPNPTAIADAYVYPSAAFVDFSQMPTGMNAVGGVIAAPMAAMVNFFVPPGAMAVTTDANVGVDAAVVSQFTAPNPGAVGVNGIPGNAYPSAASAGFVVPSLPPIRVDATVQMTQPPSAAFALPTLPPIQVSTNVQLTAPSAGFFAVAPSAHADAAGDATAFPLNAFFTVSAVSPTVRVDANIQMTNPPSVNFHLTPPSVSKTSSVNAFPVPAVIEFSTGRIRAGSSTTVSAATPRISLEISPESDNIEGVVSPQEQPPLHGLVQTPLEEES
jgi:hypothetical protein